MFSVEVLIFLEKVCYSGGKSINLKKFLLLGKSSPFSEKMPHSGENFLWCKSLLKSHKWSLVASTTKVKSLLLKDPGTAEESSRNQPGWKLELKHQLGYQVEKSGFRRIKTLLQRFRTFQRGAHHREMKETDETAAAIFPSSSTCLLLLLPLPSCPSSPPPLPLVQPRCSSSRAESVMHGCV